MTQAELDEKRLKLQQMAMYVGIAGVIISALTLYFNTRKLE